MTAGRLFWAVILGVITILLAEFIGAVIKSRTGYKRAINALGGTANE